MDSKTISDREIAKFMNINLTLGFRVFWIVDEEGDMPDYKNGTVYSPSTNWNQLMAVVEKIEKMRCTKIGVDNEVQFNDVLNIPISAPMNDIYLCVVNFIRWFNSQSPDTIK